MTESFLDRLGDQLLAAERALVVAAPAVARRRRWMTPRTAAVLLVALAVSVPALAATTPWRPILGRPELRDTPAGTSNSPVPNDASALLAVLRRPQTDADRGPIAQKLLRNVGQQFRGVRLRSVRLVTLSPGHHALVLSTEGVGQVPGVTKGTSNPVCLVFTAGGLCGGARSLRTSGILMTGGPNVRGLVPDGVAKVVLRFAAGRSVGTDVHANVFSITGAPTTARTVPGPPGSGVRRTPPLVTSAPFTVQWLDADGRAIGPPKTK